MWRVVIILTSVACFKATVNSSAQATEVFKITTVPLQNLAPSDSRIIGGNPTTIQKYPYAVQVLFMGEFICGGSLLTSRHVLSAAHCFVNEDLTLKRPNQLVIRVGTELLNSGGFTHSVSAVVVHERYTDHNNPFADNDVAVLVLASSVKLGGNVSTARIPEQGAEVPDNSTVVHVGWGITKPLFPNMTDSPTPSDVLREVEMPTISFKECHAAYDYVQWETGLPGSVTRNMICAGLLDIGGKSACHGDSGGPLIYNGVVVGITSWGHICAKPRNPGVSAKVACYTNWIQAAISTQVSQYSGGAGVPSAGVAALLAALVLMLCLA